MAFASAEEFLSSTCCPNFRCLLVDVQLGGMSGIELHQKLAERGIRTPLIYLSAGDAFDTSRLKNCAGFFRKSVDGQTLLAAVRRALAAPPESSGSAS
jgi:FixJ family two-component response regulator